jgi:hypothetical protein
MIEVAYAGSRGVDAVQTKEPGAAGPRRHELTNPVLKPDPALGDLGTVTTSASSTTTGCSPVPAPVRERVLVHELVHVTA